MEIWISVAFYACIIIVIESLLCALLQLINDVHEYKAGRAAVSIVGVVGDKFKSPLSRSEYC